MLPKTYWLLLVLLPLTLGESDEHGSDYSSENSDENSVEDNNGDSSGEPDLKHVRFLYYANSNYTYTLDNLYQILDNEEFRADHMTNMFAPGYTVDQNAYHVSLMIKAYQKRKSVNFFLLDWVSVSNVPYTQAQKNVPPLANKIAKAFLKLFDYGMDRELFHVVGHSLASYLMSYTGKYVKKLSNNEVALSRITFLDPSNPKVHDPFILEPVSKNDAAFTDCIHTDAGTRGVMQPFAHADFFPNGGKDQPGCPVDKNCGCNHLKAVAIFAETVEKTHTHKFDSYNADSYEDFLEGRHSNKSVPMGFRCPVTARGKYYLTLKTNYGEVPGLGIIF